LDVCVYMFCFFFSSRRRHTRSKRDWSSDVCSSDLTFTNDLHKGERFDFILANPPFNVKNWNGDKLREDARWQYGVPPVGNANYAWIEHIISKLAPDGKAGFVLANGALSTSTKEELANTNPAFPSGANLLMICSI